MKKQFEPMPTVVNSYPLPLVDKRPRHIQDFEVVTKYYKCSNEEIHEMRELANSDRDVALRCYMAMAERIRFLLRYDDDPQRIVPRETINPDAYQIGRAHV